MSVTLRRRAACAAITLLCSFAPGCGAGVIRIVAEPREVPSSSVAPRILAIRDLGAPRLRPGEALALDGGDELAVIGELVLIEGEGFGRQPRVTVGGVLAEIVARATGGALVVRVPWGVRPGTQPFEVKNPRGRSALPFPVFRYALATIPSRDKVFLFKVERTEIRRSGAPISLPNARLIRFCADGQTAYLGGQSAAGRPLTATIDMVARGGPRLVATREIPGSRVVALAAAESVPLAVALSDTHYMFFDTRDPSSPAHYPPARLPEELYGEAVAAEVNPDGSLLAVLVRKENRVLLYRLLGEGRMQQLASTQVVPKGQSPVLRDLAFSHDSSTLWVVSGDAPENPAGRRYPLRLTALRIQLAERGATRSFGVLSVWRGLDLPHQAAPVALAVARGQPTASGATVRVPPANAAVFISVHDSKLLQLARYRLDRKAGLRQAVRMLQGLSPLGTLVRADLEGRGGQLFDSPTLLGSVEVTSDSQLLLAAGVQVEAKAKPLALRLVYGLTVARVFGEPRPRFLPLDEVDPESLARPFELGEVRVQP